MHLIEKNMLAFMTARAHTHTHEDHPQCHTVMDIQSDVDANGENVPLRKAQFLRSMGTIKQSVNA